MFCSGASPGGVSPVGPAPSSLLTRQLQESGRGLGGAHGARRQTDSLLFEVTDAGAVTDGSSKYVVGLPTILQGFC